MNVSNLSNEQVVEIIKTNIAPKIGCDQRIDLQGVPRQVYFEFCGWYFCLLVADLSSMSVEDILSSINLAFKRACNPPSFFERLKTNLKKFFRIGGIQ